MSSLFSLRPDLTLAGVSRCPCSSLHRKQGIESDPDLPSVFHPWPFRKRSAHFDGSVGDDGVDLALVSETIDAFGTQTSCLGELLLCLAALFEQRQKV